jgi:hypothetical protein
MGVMPDAPQRHEKRTGFHGAGIGGHGIAIQSTVRVPRNDATGGSQYVL